MASGCEMELCPNWSGDGDVCPCAVFDLERPSRPVSGGCPKCGAEWPDFHSPVGTIETVCENCGWASDEGREFEDVRHHTVPPGA
jgi:hypothetical protein